MTRIEGASACSPGAAMRSEAVVENARRNSSFTMRGVGLIRIQAHRKRNPAKLTAPPGPGYPAAKAGVMKWQTCQTQNLVGGNARVGSSPTTGERDSFRCKELKHLAPCEGG